MHDPQHITVRQYAEIFAALMGLLVLTVAAALIPFDRWHLAALGISVALTIAAVKATLVVLYFMHVKMSSALTKVFVVASLVWLAILIGLTLSDYVTRGWLPYSRGWNENPNIPPPIETPENPKSERPGAEN
jgi:cytochrome c oxidase subunit 4